MKNIHDITKEFEAKICEYTRAPYAVAVDNASNAIFLALYYEKNVTKNITNTKIGIPERTYMSVPSEIINVGLEVEFLPVDGTTIKGAYQLVGTNIFDSALRFTSNMYIQNSHMCLSFTGPFKTMSLGKGGMILTDNIEAYKWFKRARFSGRNEISYHFDNFDMIGWNMYLYPEFAARGIMSLQKFYDTEGNPLSNEDLELPYPKLSDFPIYSQSKNNFTKDEVIELYKQYLYGNNIESFDIWLNKQ